MRLLGPGLAAALAGAALVACSAGGGSGASGAGAEPPPKAVALPPTVPGDEWEAKSPEELALDAEVLEELADEAEAADSTCLFVARDGYVAMDERWRATGPGDAQEVYSITKSITSTLVGVAVDEGHLAVDDPASDFIDEWRETPADEVTVANLLGNDSGRERDLDTDYFTLLTTPDRTQYAIDLAQEAPPGEVWAYNNSAIQTLDRVLTEATGVEPHELAVERLFEPLGMDDTTMAVDATGHTAMAFGARSTCADLARFGQLLLEGGRWGGEQIVSEAWLEAATSPSTDLNEGYGYLWWLNRQGRIVDSALAVSFADEPEPTVGQQVPGAPEDLVWALGLGNQVLQVDPGSRTVVVRLGGEVEPWGADPFEEADAARVVTEAVR